MGNYNIKQGEDVFIEIPVLDEDNNKVDLTLATSIRVGFTIKDLMVQKYIDTSRESLISGYGVVGLTSGSNYQVEMNLTRAQSKTFPIGDLNAVVLVEFPDAILTDKSTEYNYTLGTVLKGSLKDEDISL